MSQSIRQERIVVTIMFLTWGTVFLDRMSQLYLAPYFAPELGISDAQVGVLAAAIAMSWAAGTFCFGALADRVGYRVVFIPMVLAFSAASIASGFVRTFNELLIVRLLMGAAEGPCWSIMNVIVQRASHPSRRGANVGFVVSAASVIGLAVAPVLTTQVAGTFGWRAAFAVAGVPGLLLAAAIWRFVEEPERDRQMAHRAFIWRDVLDLMRQRSIRVCAIGAGGFIGWLTLTNAFAPLYITKVAGRDGATAGFLLGAAGLGSFIVGIVVSRISDRAGRRATLLFSSAICLASPFLFLIGPLYDRLWLLAGLLFLSQAGQAIAALMISVVPSESVPFRLGASAIGFVTLAGELIGATLLPWIGGNLAEAHGLAAPLLLAAASMSVVFGAALALREPRSDGVEASLPAQ